MVRVPAGDPPGHRRDRIRRLLSARRSTHFDPPRPKGGNVGAAKCTQKSPAPPVPRPGGAGLGQYRNRDGRRCERGSHRRVTDGLRTRKHVICPYADAAWTGNLGRFVRRIGRLAPACAPTGVRAANMGRWTSRFSDMRACSSRPDSARCSAIRGSHPPISGHGSHFPATTVSTRSGSAGPTTSTCRTCTGTTSTPRSSPATSTRAPACCCRTSRAVPPP